MATPVLFSWPRMTIWPVMAVLQQCIGAVFQSMNLGRILVAGTKDSVKLALTKTNDLFLGMLKGLANLRSRNCTSAVQTSIGHLPVPVPFMLNGHTALHPTYVEGYGFVPPAQFQGSIRVVLRSLGQARASDAPPTHSQLVSRGSAAPPQHSWRAMMAGRPRSCFMTTPAASYPTAVSDSLQGLRTLVPSTRSVRNMSFNTTLGGPFCTQVHSPEISSLLSAQSQPQPQADGSELIAALLRTMPAGVNPSNPPMDAHPSPPAWWK